MEIDQDTIAHDLSSEIAKLDAQIAEIYSRRNHLLDMWDDHDNPLTTYITITDELIHAERCVCEAILRHS